ncbi:hypothetical protein ACRAQ6_13895 [Erythrobacter sp. HA6-11]
MIKSIKRWLVPDIKDWWRWWSARVMAFGIFLHGWITFDPGAVLWIWRMMPDQLATLLPSQMVSAISIILFVLGMLMRVTRQPPARRKVKEAANVASS